MYPARSLSRRLELRPDRRRTFRGRRIGRIGCCCCCRRRVGARLQPLRPCLLPSITMLSLRYLLSWGLYELTSRPGEGALTLVVVISLLAFAICLWE